MEPSVHATHPIDSFMPTDKRSLTPSSSGVSAQKASADAMDAWNSLVDEWWRRHSETLPDELRRVMRATLDRSRAMWALTWTLPAGKPEPGGDDNDSGVPVDPAIDLWQPVLQALRACEQNVLSGEPDPSMAEEYASAYAAYVDEFAKLNAAATRRVRDKLARLDAGLGFVDLHRLMLQEAEDTYLSHVSTDEFARCQARFINALFRARKSKEETERAKGSQGKA